jgi:hypothetical protein
MTYCTLKYVGGHISIEAEELFIIYSDSDGKKALALAGERLPKAAHYFGAA